MKATISHADLLRLKNSLGGSVSSELAESLGFKKTHSNSFKPNKSISLPEQVSGSTHPANIQTKVRETPLKKEVEPFNYWYLDINEKLQDRIKKTVIGVQDKKKTSQRPIVKPLVTKTQAEKRLSKLLKTIHLTKKINVDEAVKKISQGKVVTDLPYKNRDGMPDSVYLLLDVSARLEPALPEMKQYHDAAYKLLGHNRIHVFTISHSPNARGEFILANGQDLLKTIKQNSAVIYIGDQGAYSASSIRDKYYWKLFWNRLKSATIKIGNIDIASIKNTNEGLVNDLMAAVMRCEGPQPDRIRHLRIAINEGGLAEELAVWNHHDLTHPSQIADVDVSLLHKWGRIYNQLDADKQLAIENSISEWRKYLPSSTAAMELLKGASLGLEQIDDAEKIIQIFTTHQDTVAFQRYMKSRGDLIGHIRSVSKNNEELSYASKSLRIAKYGDQKESHEEKQLLSIKQQGEKLVISVETSTNELSKLMTPVLDHSGYIIKPPLKVEKDTASYILESPQFYQKFKKTTKPNWADRIWHNADGLHAAHEDGTEFSLVPANNKGENAQWQGIHNAWSWASDYGIDSHGLWAVLSVKAVKFKLRWIHAGTFIMGSPEDEEGRYENEVQHEVTLSKGYWMAETTVTQEQWQAVMGNNPSYSKQKKRHLPVNTISWQKCQKFTQALKSLIPDFSPKLPSEAQWEYACRAGTETAYWWGDEFDETKANKSEGFIEESRLPKNPFGLKSMSGNVYEWCNDGYGSYSKQAVTDPEGAADSSERVLRGGSWLGLARDLRSAFRLAFSPDLRIHLIGLRLAGGFDPQAGSNEAMLTADRRREAKPVRRQSSIVDNNHKVFKK